MFTIRQNKTFGLTRNGLKWEHNTLAVAPVASNSADSLTKAKGLLKKIKESIFDTTELKELQELLKKAKVENDTKKDDLYSLLNDALKPDSGFSERDKADIQKIKDAWDKDFRDMDATNTKDTQEKKAEVKKVFATAKVEMPPENKKLSELTREANGELTLDSMQFVLADLDGSGEIESTNRGWFKRTFLG